ncbi:Hint domain-containing protein [Sulfitobacter donghicola]|uniref:2,3,4,5-tetrahydropyridine-2-carboxylate N-succinyltransferase n=1 Tax=Sulfitobacter donghicola DSW-25 = KCTC 12864 = JCM 14565 TaxID=1300350 RepID=A0A073IM77_9RHOB|nr:Hint domain-containing protein [Sulfitobacter donghicola]KEJ90581.1 2,3,4,5-tetrahydropyridine-2-carboxylate N-succinyltransferase [Sulfitobacter donghicola DSW-25 = KCTC 12864 = JCM 14565]KIN67828.1 2,3,4,5-tetrahydropyridine-2-carboxylate N-succinyltransferase [Sulfitobacter donghicola DSW-25 = KCTC 12864 = JCM 14565]
MVTASELSIETVREGTTATDMAQEIFGTGVTVTGATYYGDNDSAGIYTGGDSTSPGVVPGDTGVIMSTGEAEDFTNSSGQSNQSTNTTTNTSGTNNFNPYNTAAGGTTYDASTLDIDFIPDNDKLTMQFVFSSEEYPEFANSIYQDFFGVWINGQFVEHDVGDGTTAPFNISTTNNINMYVDNTNDDYNTEMDGFTITLTLTMDVNPGVTNSMRIALADTGDSSYDSNVLIAGDSIQTELIAVSDDVNVYPDGTTTLDVLSNDINNTGGSTLTVTHINGQPVAVGTTVILPTGQAVTLNADGTFNIVGDGDEEDFNFTYTVNNGSETDVGFVNATSVPCFVAGTLIATPDGDRRAETLQPGDLVMTKDEGAQPLRWLGSRKVAATGDFAPIHIRANTLGQHRDLLVSPLHRVLIKDNLAELLFGEAEVLVAARDLVNDHSITRREGGEVTYVHLLFDRHQVVFSEGLETESFLPGPQTASSFEAEVVEEIYSVFPELDPETGAGYPIAARRMLKRYEAELLRAVKVA